MLSSFVLFTSLLCFPATVYNTSGEWNIIDSRQLSFSKKRCGEIYKKSPCLKYFWKVEENLYRVICGRKK